MNPFADWQFQAQISTTMCDPLPNCDVTELPIPSPGGYVINRIVGIRSIILTLEYAHSQPILATIAIQTIDKWLGLVEQQSAWIYVCHDLTNLVVSYGSFSGTSESNPSHLQLCFAICCVLLFLRIGAAFDSNYKMHILAETERRWHRRHRIIS